MTIKQVLAGHVSPETAFLVDDYPYGFRLRCKIRYWLEFKAKKGVRFVSQTSNPKLPGLVWNKPKASTYAEFGGAMFLDENGHVQWSGLNLYAELGEMKSWHATFGAGLPAAAVDTFNHFLALKEVYESEKAAGMPYQYAGMVATLHINGKKPLDKAREIVRGIMAKNETKEASTLVIAGTNEVVAEGTGGCAAGTPVLNACLTTLSPSR